LSIIRIGPIILGSSAAFLAKFVLDTCALEQSDKKFHGSNYYTIADSWLMC